MALYPNSGLPFYRQYPYTNFEQLNLDYLLNEVGSYSRRIQDLEQIAVNHEGRITNNTNDITDLKSRMDAAEDDIKTLGLRLDTAEGDISDIKSDINGENGIKARLDTAENDIDSLEGRMDTAEGDIDALQDAVTGLGGLPNRVQSCENDITALDGRVDALEDHSVVANPGGSGVTLNTLAVDGTVYSVPQGGGGGGSSVTPNPAGSPTAGDLEKIDIDGSIFAIPSGVDTSDLIAGAYDPTDYYDTGDLVIYNGTLYRALEDGITGAWDDSKWVETTCAEECQGASSTATAVYNMYADLGTAYEDDNADLELDTRASGMDAIPGVNRTLTPGAWIVTLNCTFDTHLLGSKQRMLNIYLVDDNDNIIAQFGKYMWGSEAIQGVLYANSCTLSAVVDVPINTTKHIYGKVAVRVNTGSGTYNITDIKLGSVRIKPYA